MCLTIQPKPSQFFYFEVKFILRHYQLASYHSCDSSRIAYANQIENIPLDWALGAFILQNSSKLDMQHSNWIISIIGGDSSALILVFGIFLVLILMTWIILKLRKPQLKTIYDLEKGKYIITRVGRYSQLHMVCSQEGGAEFLDHLKKLTHLLMISTNQFRVRDAVMVRQLELVNSSCVLLENIGMVQYSVHRFQNFRVYIIEYMIEGSFQCCPLFPGYCWARQCVILMHCVFF